jgi:hypothetical protein
MKEEYRPEIPQSEAKLNLAPAFGNAVESFVAPLIQAALAKEAQPPPAPVAAKNSTAGPPKKSKPGELAALPAPQIDQIEDSSQPIADPPLKRKSLSPALESIKSALLSKPFTDLAGEAVVEALPELQQQLLEEGVISEPILPGLRPVAFPKQITPQETIGCKIQLRLALHREPKGAPAFGYFGRSDTFCRLAMLTLNVENPAICSCFEKGNANGIQFFAGGALAKALSRDSSVLVQTLLAQVKTFAGVAPNSPLNAAAFARAIARNPLLDPIKQLPIFGQSFGGLFGGSFPLAEINLAIPTRDLGKPWEQKPA